MRFEEAYSGWGERRLTQARAAELLGVRARTFRRCIHRVGGQPARRRALPAKCFAGGGDARSMSR